jgi:hypothetical protein
LLKGKGLRLGEYKYKYRWVKDPESYGYSQEQKKELKTRSGYKENEIMYRINNPGWAGGQEDGE